MRSRRSSSRLRFVCWFRGNYRHAGARLRELALVCAGMVLLASYVFLVYEGPLVPMLL